MDSDELVVLYTSVLIASFAVHRWGRDLWALEPRGGTSLFIRRLLVVCPAALLLLLGLVLTRAAAQEVRDDWRYVSLFLFVGAVWLIGVARILAALGVSARDDALERNNLAAAIAVAGALTGGMLIYGFANLGAGETIWTTIGPAVLASMCAFVLWGIHQRLSDASDAISIDRDSGSAVRFAGMAIGTGLIIGRAVAGNYESASATVRDLGLHGWPALPLALAAAFIQRYFKPVARVRSRALDVLASLSAFAYAACGVLDVVVLGAW